MFERKSDKPDERAQVGIGTLIVFIAMVLVAAIAAGVLINTAGFLQQSAEESGQQAGEQVTNRLQVVNTIGDIDGDYVDQVEVTVKQAPGANNIDLKATIAQWTSSSGAQDLTYVSTTETDASGSEFAVTTVVDDEDSGSITVLDDPEDRVKLIFNAASITGGNGIPEGGTATIQLNTQSGGTTTVSVAVPETLSGASSVQI